jgi:hypothetical protein
MTRQGRAEQGQSLDAAQDTPSVRTRVKLPPDPYRGENPRPPRGRGMIIFFGVLLLVLGIIAFVNRSGHGSAPAPVATKPPGAPAASAGSTQNPGDSGSTQGQGSVGVPAPATVPYQDGVPQTDAEQIPTGYPDTLAGAESAAANYVVAYNSATMLQPSVRHEFVAITADPAIVAARQIDLDNTFDATARNLGLSADGLAPAGSTLVEQASPLGVTVVSHDPPAKTATVAVWIVTVGGLAGAQSTVPVTSAWWTVTVNLHYTDGDWKWQSFTQTDGPTPISGQQTPSTTQQWQDSVNRLGGLRYVR